MTTREEKAARDRRIDEILQLMKKDDKAPGFDYAAAVKDLQEYGYSLEQIAWACNYGGASGLHAVKNGTSVPLHPQGERLWTLYVHTFKGDKSKEWPDGKVRPPFKPFNTSNIK